MKLSTHRAIQLSALADKAQSERVSCYCRAIKAVEIHNAGAARYFTQLAIKWERLRCRVQIMLGKDALARAKGE